MIEYDFTLKFSLPDPDADVEGLEAQLAEAGCDDALLGVGQRGRIALSFTRKSASAASALSSALADVGKAIPGVRLIEASPDLVGLTDVADFVGVSRQNMRSLMLRHAESFPCPVHEGNPSIWHLADVLQWLGERAGYTVDQRAVDVARAAMQINIAKEARALTREAVDAAEQVKRFSALLARLEIVADRSDAFDPLERDESGLPK